MSAFSTLRESAITSMVAISQSSQEAPVPNTAVANVEKIVYGSASAAFDSEAAPRTTTNATGIIV